MVIVSHCCVLATAGILLGMLLRVQGFSESLQHYTKMPVQIWSADRAIVCSANALFTTAPAANYNSHYTVLKQ